jgi:predicted ATPase/DNA-binding SARP family transcriptional activator
VYVALLGPLEVRDDADALIEIPGARLRALLTRLAVEPGRTVGTDSLIDAVWGERPPAGAANALQTLVSRLRRVIPGRLESLPTGYRLAIANDDVDVGRFERLIATGHPAEARTLWRGPPAFHPARLTELYLQAVESTATDIAELEALIAQYPLRERLRELHLRALVAAGRPAEALAAYETTRSALADALGTDPSPALRDLHAAILRAETSPTRGNLRIGHLTSFVGRTEERPHVHRLLESGRLVTLVGPGGAGKTRLATEVGGEWMGRRDLVEGGAWLVELASVRDPLEVPAAVLTALGIRETALLGASGPATTLDPLDRLVHALRDQRVLVVLDNCEHLVDVCARLAAAVLAACPHIRILATSREPLGVIGETLCPIGPLPLPPPDPPLSAALESPAVRLFVDRATAVRPDFRLTDENLPGVLEICRRLDGLPLAIELACARLHALPVAEIAKRLGERFRLLTGGNRAALPRHRTLLGVVEWSWDLFSEPERIVARRLSVFPGDADPESAEAVCGDDGVAAADVLGLVSALVDKSFVQLIDREDGPARFHMLDTIRTYAIDVLTAAGEADAVRARHAEYFAAIAEVAEPALRTKDQLRWFAWLRREHDNVVAALRWAVDSERADIAIRLVAALGWYWLLRGSHIEASGWYREAFALRGVDDLPRDLRAVASSYDAVHHAGIDDLENSERAGARTEGLAGAENTHPAIVMATTIRRMQQHDMDGAVRLLESLREHEDTWIRGTSHLMSGHAAEHFGDAEGGARHFATARDLFAALGERWGLALAVSSLAMGSSLTGDHEAAIAAMTESARLAEELGAEDDAGRMITLRGHERLRAGDIEGARADLTVARRLAYERGSAINIAYAENGFAELARRTGDYAAAQRLALLARGAADGIGVFPVQIQSQILTTLGRLEVDRGELDAARERLVDALDTVLPAGDKPIIATTAEAMAALALAGGDAIGAAGLLGLAAAIRGAADHGNPDVRATEAGTREVVGDEAFDKAYEASRQLTPDAAVIALQSTGPLSDATTSGK